MSGSKCYKCNRMGHFARECPMGSGPGPRGRGGPRVSTSDEPSKNMLKEKCYKCNRPGHFARDCKEEEDHCYRCDGVGHIAKDCEHSSDEPSCYNCSKMGHIARDCPEPERTCYVCNKSGHISRQCTENKSENRNAKCYVCGKIGHISRECPIGGEQENEKRCYVCGASGHISRDCPQGESDTTCYSPVSKEGSGTPPRDVDCLTQELKDVVIDMNKVVKPSGLTFGFLGLGILGFDILKNLLQSGHKIIVWSRHSKICSKRVAAGAEGSDATAAPDIKFFDTLSEVIAAADITFSCDSDPKVAKSVVFDSCGVLQNIAAGKGFVDMTGIDASTSEDIAETVWEGGGRYLEVFLQGDKIQAEEGSLVILAAGDRSLLDDCQSCFQTIGKKTFYLGDIGNASVMNLALQMMMGIMLGGLAEGMALADRARLKQENLLEIMQLTTLACPLMVDKAKMMIDGGFPTRLPLEDLQRDLRLGIEMGDNLELPLPIAAVTNEVFKHAKKLGYGEHDVSSVYIPTQF